MSEKSNITCLDLSCQDVVECLEILLSRARAGELQGMFYGYWEKDTGSVLTGIAGTGTIKDAFYAFEAWRFDWFASMGGQVVREERKGPQGDGAPEDGNDG